MSSNLLETSLVTAQIIFVGLLQLFHIIAARVRVKYNFSFPRSKHKNVCPSFLHTTLDVTQVLTKFFITLLN